MDLELTATPARTASPVPDFYVLFLDKRLPLAYSSTWVILRHAPRNADLLIGVFAFWISLLLSNSFIRNTYAKHTASCTILGQLAQVSYLESTPTQESANVDSKRLTENLNSLESTFMKKPGGGGQLLLTTL